VLKDPALAEINRVVDALQDPTRRRILLRFYEDPSERTVDEVARDAGVHRTVAFTHLERLAALGYLSTGQRRGQVGKPAKLYRSAARQIELSHPTRRFSQLAILLATGLHTLGPAGVEAARRVGQEFGRGLVDRPAASIDAALAQLAPLGAAYTVNDSSVVATNCVFREACDAAPEIVCELHAGVLEGALEAAGFRQTVSVGRDSARSRCAYWLT